MLKIQGILRSQWISQHDIKVNRSLIRLLDNLNCIHHVELIQFFAGQIGHPFAFLNKANTGRAIKPAGDLNKIIQKRPGL